MADGKPVAATLECVQKGFLEGIRLALGLLYRPRAALREFFNA